MHEQVEAIILSLLISLNVTRPFFRHIYLENFTFCYHFIIKDNSYLKERDYFNEWFLKVVKTGKTADKW